MSQKHNGNVRSRDFRSCFCSHRSMQCIESFMIMCFTKSFFTFITYLLSGSKLVKSVQQCHDYLLRYRSCITSTRWQHRATQKLYYKHTMTASCNTEAVLQAHDDSIVQHRSCITSTRWQHHATQKLYYKHTMTASCNTEAVLQAHDDSIITASSNTEAVLQAHDDSIVQYRSCITSTRWQHRATQKLYYKHTMTASCNTENI